MTRWFRATVFFLLIALAASTQCYAVCVASVHSKTSSMEMPGCHHQSQCKTSHSQIDSAPAVDFSQLLNLFALLAAALPVLTALRVFEPCRRLLQSWTRHESPPKLPLFLSFSVLRI